MEVTDVTQNVDDESLAESQAGQPRGIYPVGAIPRASPLS